MDGAWDPRAPTPHGLVAPVGLDPSGRAGPTRGQARGPHWRRVAQGLHVPSSVDGTVIEQRVLEHAARGGVVTGWAALRLHGAAFFEGTDVGGVVLPVTVVADGGRLGPVPGVKVSREPLGPTTVRHGVRVVPPERALFDELRRSGPDLRARVVAADMTLAAGLTSAARMRRFLARHTAWRRACLVPEVLDLAEECSRSPQESRFRLVWVLDAGWPPPVCNRRVLDLDGVVLGTPDMLDVEHGVAGEHDGAAHRSRERHRIDVGREARFRAVGLEVVTVVGDDVRRPGLVVARMEAARLRTDPTAPRRWRLRPAPETLDQRLDHEDWLRRTHEL